MNGILLDTHILLWWLADAPALPLLHHDPFDRMLIAQAVAESLTIATRDGLFKQYPVTVLSPTSA